jgi:hypothetical protein
MAKPVATNSEEIELILRFLTAAERRCFAEERSLPLKRKDALAALSWLHALTGKINEDGSLIGKE